VRVLATTTRGAGHFGPMVPFLRALERAGHDVLVAVPESATAMVEREGFELRATAEPPRDELGAVFGRVGELPFDEQNALVLGEVFARIHARAALPGVFAAVEQWRPDVVVREQNEYAGDLAAERHDVPHVRVATGLAQGGSYARPHVAGPLDALRGELGLASDPSGAALEATPALTLVPPSLEDPGDPGPPWTHRFRDAGAEGGGDDRQVRGERREGDEEPLVYLTLGSVAPTMGFFPGLFRAAIDVLAPLEARVLVTVGAEQDPAALGPLPAGVRVERWIPQAQVLPEASVVVCHGGFGSTLGALAAGLPLAVLPLFADQPFNARRVAESGAGLALEGGPPAVAGLGDAVARLLHEPAFAERARAVAREIAELPPVDDSVAVLEQLARG
jgi:UDP:flavonoid glycosyltransferase YjiC (YdhE family)